MKILIVATLALAVVAAVVLKERQAPGESRTEKAAAATSGPAAGAVASATPASETGEAGPATTAKLPRIAIRSPESDNVIGRNTEDQMLIGVFWGYIAMMEGLIERMRQQIGRPAQVIATGGLAILFDQHTRMFSAVDPDLTLDGLALLAERAAR